MIVALNSYPAGGVCCYEESMTRTWSVVSNMGGLMAFSYTLPQFNLASPLSDYSTSTIRNLNPNFMSMHPNDAQIAQSVVSASTALGATKIVCLYENWLVCVCMRAPPRGGGARPPTHNCEL